MIIIFPILNKIWNISPFTAWRKNNMKRAKMKDFVLYRLRIFFFFLNHICTFFALLKIMLKQINKITKETNHDHENINSYVILPLTQKQIPLNKFNIELCIKTTKWLHLSMQWKFYKKYNIFIFCEITPYDT